MPAGKGIQVTDGVRVVEAIEDALQSAAANPFQKQAAFHLRPGQQMFRLEERVQVNEALDVETHLVFAVDGVQANEETAVCQGQFLFGVAGGKDEICVLVVNDQHMPLSCPPLCRVVTSKRLVCSSWRR